MHANNCPKDDKKKASLFNYRASLLYLNPRDYPNIMLDNKSLQEHEINLIQLSMALNKGKYKMVSNIHSKEDLSTMGYSSDIEDIDTALANRRYMDVSKWVNQQEALKSVFLIDDFNKQTEFELVKNPEDEFTKNSFDYKNFLSKLTSHTYEYKHNNECKHTDNKDKNDVASQSDYDSD